MKHEQNLFYTEIRVQHTPCFTYHKSLSLAQTMSKITSTKKEDCSLRPAELLIYITPTGEHCHLVRVLAYFLRSSREELLYLTRNMTSNNFICATLRNFLCAGLKPNIPVTLLHRLEHSWPKRVTPTVGLLPEGLIPGGMLSPGDSWSTFPGFPSTSNQTQTKHDTTEISCREHNNLRLDLEKSSLDGVAYRSPHDIAFDC